MNTIGKHQIETLMQHDQWPAISIYMPVSRIGDQQDQIRYKNFLGQVEKQLVAGGMRSVEARTLLEPENKRVEDKGFWMHLGTEGLAVFLSKGKQEHYALPFSFQELIQVGGNFHIKPLVPFYEQKRFMVLALSRGNIQLFEGQRLCITEIALPEGTPVSLEEALQYDDPEKQLQYHSGTAAGGHKRGAMYHGHGVGTDDDKENLERFFQAVDNGLFPRLDGFKCPVILAGPEELQGVYRAITKGKSILKTGISKNAKDLSQDDLHAQSWKLVADDLSREEEEAIAAYRNNLGTGLVADDVPSILRAAFEGRIQTLFVVHDEQVWGTFDPETQKAVITGLNDTASVDLLDVAVRLTLGKSGSVYMRKREDMPTDSTLCAQFRY